MIIRKKIICIIQNITYLNYLTFPLSLDTDTAQKMKFPIKDLFSKCDQIRRKLRIWSYLLKKSLMETSFLCRGNCIVFERIGIQNHLCSLEFVTHQNLEHGTMYKSIRSQMFFKNFTIFTGKHKGS